MDHIIKEKRLESMKQKGKGFFDVEFQRTQGKKVKKRYFDNKNKAKENALKGGLASGKIWTEAKRESSREKGKVLGKNFGKKGGIKSQDIKVVELLSKVVIWYHEPTDTKLMV